MMFRPSNALMGLVGDVGGTSARFALARRYGDETHLSHCQSLSTADFPDIYAALNSYFAALPELPKLDFAILAVAGPVRDGEIRFTNLDWVVREGELRQVTGAGIVKLINDYAALAYCLPHLHATDFHTIGAAADGYGDVFAVMGAGTGFGASVLIDSPVGAVCLPTESGHIAFSPVGELEMAVDQVLRRKFGRVTVEMLLSGVGLVNLYQAICEVRGETPCDLTPAEVTHVDGPDASGCKETIMTFWDVMASVCGDFVLSHGATAGVYLAGGIAPKLMKHIDPVRFRARMEDKAPLSDMVRGVPSRIITHPYPALIGAANAFNYQDMLTLGDGETVLLAQIS